MVPCQAHAAQVARRHYNLTLKKKVWLGWHSLVQKHWKVKVERACRARAEEVCANLSTEYEAKLAEVNRGMFFFWHAVLCPTVLNDWLFLSPQHCEAIEKAQAEIQRLQLERERYEESMKKAFMRGVCALNMEALSMFNTTEARPEETPVHEQHGQLHKDHTNLLLENIHLFEHKSSTNQEHHDMKRLCTANHKVKYCQPCRCAVLIQRSYQDRN